MSAICPCMQRDHVLQVVQRMGSFSLRTARDAGYEQSIILLSSKVNG